VRIKSMECRHNLTLTRHPHKKYIFLEISHHLMETPQLMLFTFLERRNDLLGM
jgi:hypothetical protein